MSKEKNRDDYLEEALRVHFSKTPNIDVISLMNIDDKDSYPQEIIELSKKIKIEGSADIGRRKEEQDKAGVLLVPVINGMQDDKSISDMLSNYFQDCVTTHSSDESGATLAACYVSAQNKALYLGNMGDSRIVINIEYFDEKEGVSYVRSVLVTEDHDVNNERIMEMLNESKTRSIDGSYLVGDNNIGVQTTSSIGDASCHTNKIPDQYKIDLEKFVKNIFGNNAKLDNCKKIQIFACCDGITEGAIEDIEDIEDDVGYATDKNMIAYDYKMKPQKVRNESGEYEWKWEENVRDEDSFYHAVDCYIQSKLQFKSETEKKKKSKDLKKITNEYYLFHGDVDILSNDILKLFKEEANVTEEIILQENIQNIIFSNLVSNLVHQEKLKHLILEAIKEVMPIKKIKEQDLENNIKECIQKRDFYKILEHIEDVYENESEDVCEKKFEDTGLKNAIFSKLAEHINLDNLILSIPHFLEKWFKYKVSNTEDPIEKELETIIRQYFEKRDVENLITQFCNIIETYFKEGDIENLITRFSNTIENDFEVDMKYLIDEVPNITYKEEKNTQLKKIIEVFIFSEFTAMVNSNQIKIDDKIEISRLIVNHALKKGSTDNVACAVATIDESFFKKTNKQEDSVDILLFMSDGHGEGGEKVSDSCGKILEKKVFELRNLFKTIRNSFPETIRNRLDLIEELKINDKDLDFYIKIISEKLWNPKKDSYLISNNIDEIEQGIYLVNQLKLLTFKKICNDEKNVNFDRSKKDIDLVVKRLKQQKQLYPTKDQNTKFDDNFTQLGNAIEEFSKHLNTLQNQIKKNPIALIQSKKNGITVTSLGNFKQAVTKSI